MNSQNKSLSLPFIAAMLCVLNLFMATNQANAAIIKTDIVMLVDESGSMGTIHDNLSTSIGTFASILQAGGLDVQFALVGFGKSGDTIRLLSDFIDAAGISQAFSQMLPSPIGADEPIYDATAYALNALSTEQGNISYREDAVSNLIVFADEASNSDKYYDATSVDALLKASSALFNVVLGGDFTELVTLAQNNGGNSFDLNALNTTDESAIDEFMTEFAEVKLQETLDFCKENPDDPACADSEPVPAPASLFLISLGLLLIFRRQFN